MSSIVGTQPPGFVVSGSVVGISMLTKIAATAYVLWQGAQFFVGATQPSQQVKTAPVTTAEAQAPPAAQLPPEPNPELGTDSLSYQEPTPEPIAAPPSPVQATQESTVSQIPKPDPIKVQSPLDSTSVSQPLPAPDAGPGTGIAGGVVLPGPWGAESWQGARFKFGGFTSVDIAGYNFDSVVYEYTLKPSDLGYVYVPQIILKKGSSSVYAYQFGTFTQSPPDSSAFDVLLVDTTGSPTFKPISANYLAAVDPNAYFLPARVYVPKTVPQVEPTPAYAPEPAPNPFQPVPSTPPATEPLPQEFPDTPVIPAPTPTKPKPLPLPEPLPETEAPSLTPNAPPSVPAVDEDGKPVVLPPVTTTPDDIHVIGNDHVINSGKIQPTLNAIASEVGRIENKLAWMAKPNPAGDTDIGDIFEILGFLRDLFEPDTPEAIYRLISVCEKNAQGEPVSQAVEQFIPAASPLDAITARIDALVPLVQGLKDFKQPTCSETPTPSPTLRDPVTINFTSDEGSPISGDRIRKLFRYFDESGATLLDTTNHWRDFVWNAGPFMVSCNGTTLGKPQVWASSNAEGRRVIEHAAAITGCDMSKVEWVYATSRSARYGQPGTMRIHRNQQGLLGITKRDGPDGWPEAYS